MRILIFLFLGVFASLGVSSCSTPPGDQRVSEEENAEARLKDLYEKAWSWGQREDGKRLSAAGTWEPDDHWPQVDEDAQLRRLRYWENALAELARIPSSDLDREEQINAAVFEQVASSRASDLRYKTYQAPLNSDTFFWIGLHPRNTGFTDLGAYERYLGRVADVPRYLLEHQANMRAGMERGYTVPQVALAGRENSIEAYLVDGQKNPFWAPFEHFPQTIAQAEQERLRAKMRELISSSIVPAYGQLLSFLRTEYIPVARTSIAAKALPNGEAFYREQIRTFTTLDLSPEEIYQTGLSEVARIRKAQEAILEELNFSGTMADFFAFLRSDPRFYASTPEELMGVSAYVAKRMDGKLSEVLGFLPRRRFAINPVPAEIAPTYTSGRGGLNACLMNTYNLSARPLYAIPALTLHECAPGHALQAAIALEAPGQIPEFRANNYFSGYGEGWGLYTEWLGGEIGIYRTPYERFGQLTFEMWRACRLVIDTGLHQFDWTRQQAIDYLSEHAALSAHDIETEIDRYISWPGQALSYKLGEMLIREKRASAETRLGADFDQRYFHDVILSLRSVPLSVLAEELESWIKAGGPNPYEQTP
ncbi:MAG: DUF885 family protein [Pseudomonadota bacterium]